MKNKVRVGDTFSTKVGMGKDGFAIVNKEGLICFIDKYSTKHPAIGELWKFTVKKKFEKYAIVTPVEKLASENGLMALDQITIPKKVKKEKTKFKFPFLSKAEQRH